MSAKKTIPIFYACDDSFVKFTVVSLKSMIENASREYKYSVCILHTGISKKMMDKVFALEDECFRITFEDVSGYIKSISDRLPLRDYYSKTTYFRLFIAEMFPGYDKAIYIDSDTVVTGDISRLYETEIGDNYIGAANEQAMVQVDEYGSYVEKCIGINRNLFFNAGILLINCNAWREHKVLDRFMEYLFIYNFVVTQDEDYLNVICRDHVYFLDQRWNTEVFGEIPYPIEEANVIHYIMTSKPWYYADCRHGEFFWKYAKMTSVYDEIQSILDNYTDEERERDRKSCDNLLALAVSETNKEDTFVSVMKKRRSAERNAIVEKIEEYEREGKFDVDVEADPPSEPLTPDKIDYLGRGIIKKVKTKLAYGAARRFLRRILKEKKLIIRDIIGAENFRKVNTGAIITCNHFNAYDSFAMQMAYEKSGRKKENFYRVIREGNYTSFPGFYGFLMRNCNTLPLSSCSSTMVKFVRAVHTLLNDGKFILVYPEQSMWWNYRKPKPLKPGAYSFAARSGVPVIPCFITMKDSEILDEDGFFVQEYTVHVGEPIYPDSQKTASENVKRMMDENARVWREIYEREYSLPLTYTT